MSLMQRLTILTAKYLYVVIVLFALGFFATLKQEDRNKAILLTIIAALIAGLLTVVGGRFINDPRPFVVDHVAPFIPHAADNGFPSDHTLVAMLAALVVFVFNKRVGSVLAVFAVLVGVSRVSAGIHHPLDIAGSIMIALASILIAGAIYKRAI